MRLFLRKVFVFMAFGFIVSGFASPAPGYTDGFYPGTQASKGSFDYTSRSFLIHGKPTYIYSGEFHYARCPRELWRDRLVKMKRAGYNTVSSYAFWNAHEPIQGQFHFERNLDVDAWLSLIDSLGMYAILRVGPYVCAEWDLGGFAPWLPSVPNVKYRNSSGPFFSYVRKYWEAYFPVIMKHQIHKGGSLIAVQLENEFMNGSANTDHAYTDSIVNLAKSLGMEIPYVWSQVLNGSEPSASLLATRGAFSTTSSFPGFTTEFWMGWFNEKGEPTTTEMATCKLGTWRFLAAGTGGLTHYMVYGGTNFGYTSSDDNQNTSYDYHAPIGEEGQFHQNYFIVKQAGLFARSFESILTTSKNGASQVTVSPATGVTSYVHKSDSGSITFITNTTTAPVNVNVTWASKSNLVVPTGSATWSCAAKDWCYFLADVPLTPAVKIDYSATGILTKKKIGNRTYLVLFGSAGGKGEIALAYSAAPSVAVSAPWVWNTNANRASLGFTYPAGDSVFEASVQDPSGQIIKVLVMNTEMAVNKTWVDDAFIACGPVYVDDKNALQFPVAGGRAQVYVDTGKQVIVKAASTASSEISMTGWKWLSAANEAASTYDDSKWKQVTSTATDMANLGYPNGYGWYRLTYNAAAAGSATLGYTLGSPNSTAYGQGLKAVSYNFVNGTLVSGNTVQLKSGANTIAVLTANYNRYKEYNNYGVPSNVDKTGIVSGISINGTTATGLRFKGGFDGVVESPLMGVIPDSSWNSLMAKTWNTTATADKQPRLWKCDFAYTPPVNAVQTWNLQVTVAAAGRGVVWLNGQNVGRSHEGQPALFVPECWLKSGSNTIMILTEDGIAPQGCKLVPVEYRSLAEFSNSTTQLQYNSHTENVGNVTGTTAFLATGNTFIIPMQYKNTMKSVSLYSVSGKLLKTIVTKANVVSLNTDSGVLNGVRIVRVKAIYNIK